MHGMYILGNAETYASVPMWQKVLDMLKQDGNIGEALELCCPRHEESPIQVATSDDFVRLSPEGGCDQKCASRLRCGHACLSKCHANALHVSVRCLEPCARPKKTCDHPCPNLCGDPCESRCAVRLPEPVLLPCGHELASPTCWESQNLEKVKCLEKIKHHLPRCDHFENILCFQRKSTDIACTSVCGRALDCGHACKYNCTTCFIDPEGGPRPRPAHGPCRQICGRAYATCSHYCKSPCHRSKPCRPCRAPCESSCAHSTCSKACSEPCVPCAESVCPSSCPHAQCTMPCAAPCNWVPCSIRCSAVLACGHQCPTICGEQCPSEAFCQQCASKEIQETVVDYVMMSTYKEIDLDEDPVIIPRCGHLLSVSSMDCHLGMSDFYELDEHDNPQAVKTASQPFSSTEMKRCSTCRGSLRSVCRYGRIVRRSLLDESTRKFVILSMQSFLKLAGHFQNLQDTLINCPWKDEESWGMLGEGSIDISDTVEEQLDLIDQLTAGRHRQLHLLHRAVIRYLNRVVSEGQPYQQVWNLVQAARNRGVTTGTFTYDDQVIQARRSLQGLVLLLRCYLAVLSDVCKYSKAHPLCKKICLSTKQAQKLAKQAAEHARPNLHIKHQAEALLCWANCLILEVQHPLSDDAMEVFEAKEQAEQKLAQVKQLCADAPSQTRGIMEEAEALQAMLTDGVFYTKVTSEEQRMLIETLRKEFSRTGHFYTCANGHIFTIGECGMPMELARCNECGARIGGTNHEPVAGVQRAQGLET